MFSERLGEATKSRSVVYINNLTCTLFRTSCAMQLNLRSWITGYPTAEMGTKTYWITRKRCSIRGPLFTAMCLTSVLAHEIYCYKLNWTNVLSKYCIINLNLNFVTSSKCYVTNHMYHHATIIFRNLLKIAWNNVNVL